MAVLLGFTDIVSLSFLRDTISANFLALKLTLPSSVFLSLRCRSVLYVCICWGWVTHSHVFSTFGLVVVFCGGCYLLQSFLGEELEVHLLVG